MQEEQFPSPYGDNQPVRCGHRFRPLAGGCVKQTRKFYSLTTEYITNKRTVQYITLFGGLENAI